MGENGKRRIYVIPVEPREEAILELPQSMTPERWANFDAVLAAMRPALETPPPADDDEVQP